MPTPRVALASIVVALMLTSACRRPQRAAQAPPISEPSAVVLPAPSTEPRYAITTDDPDEIALLVQRLKLRQVLVSHGTLYFAADAEQLGKLRELGFQVARADAEAIDSRVLRVLRRGDEATLREAGVIVVTREPAYWIVSGTLAQLRKLVAAGYTLAPLAAGEPRPRWIRVVVTSADDVQRVANFDVDIFSVADTSGRYTILGAAMDVHIDRLREAGFTVVLLPTP